MACIMVVVIEIQSENDALAWNNLVKQTGGHPLQLWGWGEVKSAHGWKAHRVRVLRQGRVLGGAQLLIKRLPWPLGALAYIPRGPFGSIGAEGEKALANYVKATFRPTVLSMEPDSTKSPLWKGWHKSPNKILLARTAVLDLTQSEEDMQAAMSKKTRQYIRKSQGEGITVRKASSASDIAACLAIYKSTAKRAGFMLHEDAYYQDIFQMLGDDSPVYMAEREGRVVAFLWPVVTESVAFELYGGMNEEGQASRANYFLKWQVIQSMKAAGVKRYDVNGLLNDGVTSFKKGFIPDETMMAGTFETGLSPPYIMWRYLLPIAKRVAQLLRRLRGR